MALKRSIVRHLKDGWHWVPPYLEKGQVKKRPSTLMPMRMPGDKGYRWQDAYVMKRYPQCEYIGAGRYRLGNLVMRHDATMLDERACPECNDAPWFVKIPDTSGKTVPEVRFTYCRRCVTAAELEDAAYRKAQHEAKQAARRR